MKSVEEYGRTHPTNPSPAICWSWAVTAEHRMLAKQVAECADQEAAHELGMRLLREWQNNRCAMCGGPSEDTDHDHKTGLVRGLLCHSCNLLEGHASGPDNPYVQYRSHNPASILGLRIRHYSPFTGWAEPAAAPPALEEHPAYILGTLYGVRRGEEGPAR